MNKKVRGKREEVRGEAGVKAQATPKLPIWKTAKHSTEVESKIRLPHAVDPFTAQRMVSDALPYSAAIVSLEVKYVMFCDLNDSKRLGDECWKEYMDNKEKAFKKGGAK